MTEAAVTDDGAKQAGRSIARNAGLLVIPRVLAPALSILLILVLSRTLGSAGVGRYVLAYGFLNVLGTLGTLGLQVVIIREGSGDRAALERMLGHCLTLGVATSVVLTALMLGAGAAFGYDPETRSALAVLSLCVLPLNLGTFLESAIVAMERTIYIVIATLAEYTLKVGLGVGLLAAGFGLDAVLAAAVLGRLLACLIEAGFLSRAGIRVGFGRETTVMRDLLRMAPTFVAVGVFATLYWRIDILMLSKLAPIEDVGLYGAAWRLLLIGMVLPQGLCLALYPHVAIAARGDGSRLRDLSSIAVRYLSAATLPAAACIAFLGPQILTLVYGPGFEAAGTTLAVLIWTLVPYGIVRYHAYVLVAANRQRVDLLVNVVMSVGNVLLNLALIPRYGHVGAATATLISICVYALVQSYWLKRSVPFYRSRLRLPPAVLLAAGLAALCAWGLRDVNVLLAAAAAGMVYVAALFAGRFFTDEELALFGIARREPDP